MAESLLYFPYINLPKTDWTVRTLLYYEKVGSVVPMDFFYEPERNYDAFMLEMVREELVVPINPMDKLEHPWQLNKPFLYFIQSDGYNINRRRDAFNLVNQEPVNQLKFMQRTARVSSQKFDGDLMYNLKELGLAKHKKQNWYAVEKITANYLMAYLASVLAGKLEMLPTTDKTFTIDFLRQFRKVTIKVSSKRDEVLKELIPMPTDINLSKLQKFKERNSENLNRFKNVVEQIALNPIYDDEVLLNEKIKELKYEKETLTARMNETNFGSIFFGTACGIFGAVQGIAQADTTSAFVGGLPGFASAIYSALKIEKAENTFDQTGMKYLSLTDKRLRLKR